MSEYINKQITFRDGVGIELSLTQDQIKAFESVLQGYNETNTYYAVGHNCGEPLETALQNFNYDVGNYIFPVSLFLDIHNSGAVKSSFNIYKVE